MLRLHRDVLTRPYLLSCSVWFLATNERLRAPSRYLSRNRSGEHLWFLWIAMLSIGVFWLLIVYWDRYANQKQQRGLSEPEGLAAELCHAHRLSRREQQLVQRAARQHCPDQAGMIFVDPRILGVLARDDAEYAGEYSALGKKLFGEMAARAGK